jgi:hypothetical protein
MTRAQAETYSGQLAERRRDVGVGAPVYLVSRHYRGGRADLLPQLKAGYAGRFAWGDGPAPHRVNLARALLADALGDRAACDECGGTGKIVYLEDEGRDVPFNDPDAYDPDPLDVGECVCEDGRRPLPVADFDTDRISQLAAPWWLSRREILAWLTREYPQAPPWLAEVMTEVVDPQGRI